MSLHYKSQKYCVACDICLQNRSNDGSRKHHYKKASGVDGIPAEIFQILKDDTVKVLHSIGSKFGKLSSGHRTGKGQF